MKSVTYSYQFFACCEVLVLILHDVKFTMCEIKGSTKVNSNTAFADTTARYVLDFYNCNQERYLKF